MKQLTAQEFIREADPHKLMSVESAVKQARNTDLDTYCPTSVYFLCNFTISAIEPFADFHCLKRGLNAQIRFGDYNVIHQPLMQPDSDLQKSSPQILVLALMYEVLAKLGGSDVCAQLQELFDLAAAKTSATIIINTFLSPPSANNPQIQIANDFIRNYASDNGARFVVCDWDSYLRAIGHSEAFDRRYWYMAKAPFKPPFLSFYGSDIAKIASAINGKNKKCLVLDCDGTLWGGVVGEDGMDGIALHADDYPGNAYYEIQQTLLQLHQRGVVLAINSKNNEADVFDVFEKHPHCLLKKEHFSALRINWDNKIENMGELADELNLAIDSFVFLDDSDFECNMVRDMLPEIEVCQVPGRAYEYPAAICALTDEFFFTTNVTGEDANRGKLYEAKKKADGAKVGFENIDDYLRSLDITADMHVMREDEIARVSQLTQKTNQFNLAKTPYSEADISEFHESDAHSVYVMVVGDRFGALGLTNVCIVNHTEPNQASINTFLMSCRVFERNLESVFLDFIMDCEKGSGRTAIDATFKRTPKNQVAENFYEKMGFRLQGDYSQEKSYVLDVSDYSPTPFDYIRIV